jgi:hypothetical protein
MADHFFREFKNGYGHGKGELIDYFLKWTQKGKFLKGSFKKSIL